MDEKDKYPSFSLFSDSLFSESSNGYHLLDTRKRKAGYEEMCRGKGEKGILCSVIDLLNLRCL